MENIEAVSADLGRKVATWEAEGATAKALSAKVEWSKWRDSLEGEEKERCIIAFTAVTVGPLSQEALELLKEQNPLAWTVHMKIR